MERGRSTGRSKECNTSEASGEGQPGESKGAFEDGKTGWLRLCKRVVLNAGSRGSVVIAPVREGQECAAERGREGSREREGWRERRARAIAV